MDVRIVDPEENKKQALDADYINAYVRKLFEFLNEQFVKAKEYAEQEVLPIAKEWMKAAEDIGNTKVVFKQVEFLTMETLIEIVKENKVQDSNANIVYRRILSDGTISLLITYLKNKELIPADKNINISIEAEGMSKQIKELFGSHDVVVMV